MIIKIDNNKQRLIIIMLEFYWSGDISTFWASESYWVVKLRGMVFAKSLQWKQEVISQYTIIKK